MSYQPEAQKIIRQALFDYRQTVKKKLDWQIVLPKYFDKKEVRKVKNGFYTLCPFHQEKTASMYFSYCSNHFRCYGCGSSGSIFQFIVLMEGGQSQAYIFIKRHFHIPLPYAKGQWKRLKNQAEEQELDWDNLLEQASDLAELEEARGQEREKSLADDEWLQKGTVVGQDNKPASLASQANERDKFAYLKMILIIRHADYNNRDRISIKGFEQIMDLMPKVRDVVENAGFVLVTSSTAPRATDTANVIAEYLGCDYREDELFWSDNKHRHDLDAAANFIFAQDKPVYGVQIVVTHKEYCSFLPGHISRKKFGKQGNFHRLEKGQALVIDLETEKIKKIN